MAQTNEEKKTCIEQRCDTLAGTLTDGSQALPYVTRLRCQHRLKRRAPTPLPTPRGPTWPFNQWGGAAAIPGAQATNTLDRHPTATWKPHCAVRYGSVTQFSSPSHNV